MFGLRLDPIAFSLGPIDVHWYGIILGTAALGRSAAGCARRQSASECRRTSSWIYCCSAFLPQLSEREFISLRLNGTSIRTI